MVAVTDQGRVNGNNSTLDGLTKTLPELYQLPTNYFHDITSGSNGHSALPGYDLVTGFGSPVANNLIVGLELGIGALSKLAFVQQPTSTAAGGIIDGATGIGWRSRTPTETSSSATPPM